MAAPFCPLLGDGITDDTLLHITRFLPTARDLLCLLLTNTRFSIKCIAAPAGGGAAAAPEMLSLVGEAARQWVAGCSEQERGWVPRCELESLLGLMHRFVVEVEVLRQPLVFGRALDRITACLRTGRWQRGTWAPASGSRRARSRCGQGATSCSSR